MTSRSIECSLGIVCLKKKVCSRSKTELVCTIGTPLDSPPSMSIKEVADLLSSMLDKSFHMDFIPILLFKSCQIVFAAGNARRAHLSFNAGQFPTKFTLAPVSPFINKAGLNRDDPPITGLSPISMTFPKLLNVSFFIISSLVSPPLQIIIHINLHIIPTILHKQPSFLLLTK